MVKAKSILKRKIDESKYTTKRVENTTNIPYVIYGQYNIVMDMYEKQEYYGAIYQIKDVLELSLKFPLLIMLAIVAKHVEDEDDEIAYDINNKKSFNGGYSDVRDFLQDVLCGEISFGSLERFGKGLATLDEAMAPSKYRDEFLAIQSIIRKIIPAYFHPRFLDREDNCISSWRNRVIGHGALNPNKEELKKDLDAILCNLNAIISVSDYSAIHIKPKGKSYIVWVENKDDILDLSDYIVLNDETGVEFSAQNYESSYLFESYNRSRGKAKLLDYINNKKRVDDNLSLLLNQLANKMNIKQYSSNKILSSNIDSSDEEAIMDIKTREMIMVPAFFEETRELLSKDKGILILRSERGTGKTIFSRSIINNFDYEEGNRYRIVLDEKGFEDITEELLSEDDDSELFVCVYNFNNHWMNTTNSFLFAFERSLNPKKAVHEDYMAYRMEFGSLLVNRESVIQKYGYEDYQRQAAHAFNMLLKSALEIYEEKNGESKLLIVFDGIDELPDGIDVINISDFLDESSMPENTYVLILGRTEKEWCLPAELKSKHFLEKEIKKDRFAKTLSEYVKKYVAEYRDNDIAVERLIQDADLRILYLRAICDIIRMGYRNRAVFEYSLEKLPQIYVNTFTNISKRYHNDIKLLLSVFSITNKPLNVVQLCFLFSGEIMMPDFRYYFLLMDISGFLAIYRENKVNTYMIGNAAWKKGLADSYFDECRSEVISNVWANISSMLNDSLVWSSEDIYYLNTVLCVETERISVAKAVLSFIERSLENGLDTLALNYDYYFEAVNAIEVELKEHLDEYIHAIYTKLLLVEWKTDEFDKEAILIDSEFNYNNLLKIIGRYEAMESCDRDTIGRIIHILSWSLKANISASENDKLETLKCYAYVKAVLNTAKVMLENGVELPHQDELYELPIFMRMLSSATANCDIKESEYLMLNDLNLLIADRYACYYKLSDSQFKLYGFSCSDNTNEDNYRVIEDRLLQDAKSVASRGELSKAEKARYFKRLYNFYLNINIQNTVLSKHSVEWRTSLIKKSLVPRSILSDSYINKQILRLIIDVTKQYKDVDSVEHFKECIDHLTNLLDCLNTNVDDVFLEAYYHYVMVARNLNKIENVISGDAISSHVLKALEYIDQCIDTKKATDGFVIMALLLQIHLYACESGNDELAKIVLDKYQSIMKSVRCLNKKSIDLFVESFLQFEKGALDLSGLPLLQKILPDWEHLKTDIYKMSCQNRDDVLKTLILPYVTYGNHLVKHDEVSNALFYFNNALSVHSTMAIKRYNTSIYKSIYSYFCAYGNQGVKEILPDPDTEWVKESEKAIDAFENGFAHGISRIFLVISESDKAINSEDYKYGVKALEKNIYKVLCWLILSLKNTELAREYSKIVIQALEYDAIIKSLKVLFRCCSEINDYKVIIDKCTHTIGDIGVVDGINRYRKLEDMAFYMYFREKAYRAIGENELADKDLKAYNMICNELGIPLDALDNCELPKDLSLKSYMTNNDDATSTKRLDFWDMLEEVYNYDKRHGITYNN